MNVNDKNYYINNDNNGITLIDTAYEKLKHPIHAALRQSMPIPYIDPNYNDTNNRNLEQMIDVLSMEEMTAILLYTGCDCYSDLRCPRLNGNFTKWKYFSYFLEKGIKKLYTLQWFYYFKNNHLINLHYQKSNIFKHSIIDDLKQDVFLN